MRAPKDRPGLDQRPLPWPQREVTYCLVCGEQGTMVRFAPDGIDVVQVHVVHRWLNRCPECGGSHPSRVCVVPSWPPSRWDRIPVRFPNHKDPLSG